jgi:serine-type D-Ala-D-Ala carboxypeptidase (penicillin-binding protein 5/6)
VASALTAVLVAALAVLLLGATPLGKEDKGSRHRTSTRARGVTSAQASDDRSRRSRPLRSPYQLRPAPARLPVDVRFARKPGAGILFDVDSGRVLWQHDPGHELPIASLTKMITALIVARRDGPNERVLITPQAVHFQGSGVGVLPKGKKVPLRDLFYGLLLVSGNDAAIALAQHDSGSVPAFVRRMNRWRRRLGLRCSHFSNPSGIIDRHNFSCARDLATLARADLANPWIRRVVGMKEARFAFPVKGGYLDLYNNNPFIISGMKGVTGLKTGYTLAAGRCYVVTRRVRGRELGVVLLNTPNPLDQVPALLRAGAKAERSAPHPSG